MSPYLRDEHSDINHIKELVCRTDNEDPLGEAGTEEREELSLFSQFMRVLTDMELEEAEARYHYYAILDHAEHLKRHNGRRVGFHVAMCDYLINIARVVECPKLMELGKYESLLRQSTTDELTGLYNRRFFHDQLSRELYRSRRYRQAFSLLMIDVDNFKSVNDNHGHPTGDAVLRQLAGIMKGHLRAEDAAARYGGEEFVILLPQTDLTGARIFGERILDRTRGHRFPEGLMITFSGGIAGYPHHGESAAELLKKADRSLYDAKLGGKGHICCTREERRTASRFSAAVGIEVYDRAGKERHASLRDISVTGLAARAQGAIRPGDTVTLHLRDTRDRLVYKVDAQVIWVRPEHRREHELAFGAQYKERNPNLISHLIKDYIAET